MAVVFHRFAELLQEFITMLLECVLHLSHSAVTGRTCGSSPLQPLQSGQSGNGVSNMSTAKHEQFMSGMVYTTSYVLSECRCVFMFAVDELMEELVKTESQKVASASNTHQSLFTAL